MRRVLVLLPAALLIAAAPANVRSDSKCARIGDGLRSTTKEPGTADLRRLDRLPTANEYLTVLRSEDGCPKPVIVRYDVDGRGGSHPR